MGPVIASLLFRSALILGVAEVCRRFARRGSAACRYQIVLAGFVLLLLWPMCAAVVPEVALPAFGARQGSATVTVHQRFVFTRTVRQSRSTEIHWPLAIWFGGALLSLLPWALDYVKARRLIRNSTPVEDQGSLAPAGSKVRLRAHSAISVPFVFGIWHPTILVPGNWAEWPASRKRAVFLHELAHVQRRDLMWQLAVNAVTAIWWFQPLCWLNRRSLRRECETACDAAVLQSGVRASEYASELLAVAQQIRRRSSYAFAAIAMAEHCDLQRRIRAIVDSEPTRKARRPLTALVILSATTVTLSAVSLAPQIQPKSGGHSMKRTLFSGLLASAGLSAATITGSVYDQNGKVVSNAHVSIVNPDTSVAQETTTTADGKFAFDNLGAGSYILHIDKPQFAGLYREFNVQEDTNVQRGLVLQAAATSATNAVGKTGPVEPIRVRGEVAENNLTNKVTPVYPAAAKQAHVQGTVRLNVTISKEGTPEDIRVVSSPSEDLTKSALEAVRQWRYRPTLLNGEPVEITTDVIVNYTLSQ